MISSNKHNDEALIVGQGIAGTLLAFFLYKEKLPFKVIDRPLPGASSEVAAGILNPVTGRRLVKSWRFDELSNFARFTYQEIGRLLNETFFLDKTILRALQNTFEENEWMRRSGYPEYRPFLSDSVDLFNSKSKVTSPHAWGEIKCAGKLNMPELISSFRAFLKKRNLLTEQEFDHQQLMISEQHIKYQGQKFRKIIFCEGAKAVENPYFNYLPFSTTKGEILIIRVDNFQTEKILKNKVYLCPLYEKVYWVGSTNSFSYDHVHPTSQQFNSLKKDLEEFLLVPFKIIDHRAAIRPTVADKRPLLGLHPTHNSIYIFNGLGTKGASLGPYFAHQMAQFVLGKARPDAEVCIDRFSK